MKPPFRNTILTLLGWALGVSFLGACQSTGSSDPEPKGPMLAYASFQITTRDSSRLPDSIDWVAGKQSGKGRFGCVDFSCTDTLSLSEALGSDTARLRLHKLGLQIATFAYVQSGRASILTRTSASSRNDANLALLSSFFDLRKTKIDSFTKLGPPSSSQMVAYFASLVFAKSSGYTSFPDSLPVGMNVDSVRKNLVRLAASAKLPWTQVAASSWGLDSNSIHSIAIELLRAGTIHPADSLVLFPLPPLRVLKSISVAKEASAGGSAIAAMGAFSWNKGIVPVLSVAVHTRAGVDSTHFDFPTLRFAPTDTSWSLDGNLTLQALKNAAPGTDTLVVVLSDGKGNNVTSRAIFQVLPGDTIAPLLVIESPSRSVDTVESTTELFRLIALASDPSGIDSIWLGNRKALGSRCTTLVELAIGENVFTAQAWDGFQNEAKARVTILRSKPAKGDSTKPSVMRLMPRSNDSTVGWSTKTLAVAWNVTDDSSLAKVSLEDSTLVAGADGAYRAFVPLSVGKNTIVLSAFDARGNVRRDTVRIVRPSDTTKPVVVLVSPLRDTVVENSTTAFGVSVTANDVESGIDSVKIGTKVVKTAPFAAAVDLAVGANTVAIQAWNGAGGGSETISVKITRRAMGDTTKPTILRVTPKSADTTVEWDTKSMSFTWAVTDDSSVAKVLFEDSVLAGSDGVYHKTVALSVGAKTYTLTAMDARGNSRKDTVRVVRKADITKPVVQRGIGTRDTVFLKSVTSFAPTWTVTDNALQSVTIGGASVVGVAGAFSMPVGLSGDSTWIHLVATDSSGNTAKDSIKVRRVNDTTPPIFVFQKARTRQVANSVISDTLIWTVTDNLKMGPVVVQGTPVTPVGSNYTLVVALAVGTHKYVLIATDSAGNTAKDTVVVARAALPPTHSAPDGNFIGTVYDTVTSAGADSIEISWNGTTWTKLVGSVSVTGTGAKVLYARAWPGGAMKAANWTLSQIRQVAMGGSGVSYDGYTFFVKNDGSVWAAGSNKNGGFGVTTPEVLSLRPIPVTTGVKSVAAQMGGSRSIFLRPDGTAKMNTSSGTKTVALNQIDTALFGIGALFKLKDGSVWEEGFLFGYSDTDRFVPRKVEGVPGSVSISVGSGIGLALDSNHWVWGFGIPNFGEKGSVASLPIWADTLTRIIATGAKAASIGITHTIILKLDGTAEGAGLNAWGQLGKGTTADADSIFAPIVGISGINSVATGWSYSLFLKDDGSLYLAGKVTTSYLMSGTPQGESFPTPYQVANGVEVIWAGYDWCMFRKTDGTLWALGSNSEGAFGNGTRESSPIPVRINF